MSGLLHRLASQTLSGAKPVIHPVARMRYVAPLELIESESLPSPSDHPSLPGVEPGPGPRTRVTPASGPTPVARREADVVRPDLRPRDPAAAEEGTSPGVEPGPRTRVIPTSGPTPVARREAGIVRPDLRPRDPAAAEEGTSGERGAGHRTSDRIATPKSAETEHRASFVEDRLPAEITLLPGPQEAALPAAVPAGRSAEMPPPPTPLVVPVETAPFPSSWDPGPVRAAPFAPTRDEDREPTEVHVHIGRIEVTAVHEPAPPKRTRQPARKPMSLDEYLSRRGGRSE